MKVQHKTVVLLLLIPCLTPVSRADDASKDVKVRELFRLMKIDKTMAQVQQQALDQVKSGIYQEITGAKLSSAEQKSVDDLTDKVGVIVSKAMSWESLEPEFAKLYEQAYTEQQIEDLLAFYRSPTGQVTVEKTPLLLNEANEISQRHMATAIPEIQALLKDFMANHKDSPKVEPQQ